MVTHHSHLELPSKIELSSQVRINFLPEISTNFIRHFSNSSLPSPCVVKWHCTPFRFVETQHDLHVYKIGDFINYCFLATLKNGLYSTFNLEKSDL